MVENQSSTPAVNCNDLTGCKFGRWTVIEMAPRVPNHHVRWICRCDCGTVKSVDVFSLRNGDSISCGCARSEQLVKRLTKHGQCGRAGRSPEWRSWNGMIRRCTYPSMNSYHNYGGRGIVPCQGFRAFEHFLSVMGKKPTTKHSLERIDNEKCYTCGQCEECKRNGAELNCRWATKTEQQRNTRGNHCLTYNGETLCIAEWAERIGVSQYTIHRRLDSGWSIERALTTPTGPQGKRYPNQDNEST